MTSPEDALPEARAAAERKRADGAYPDSGPAALEPSIAADLPDLEMLGEWAVIEVDPENLYSSRPLGAPITWFKRVLMCLLRQYTLELESRQTRFNIALLAHFRDLEGRVSRLERDDPSR